MFVGSLKSNACCVRGKLPPWDSLKSALSDQVTPRSVVMNLHMDSSRGFLNAVAVWLDPSSLFTHCRPVPKNLGLRGHIVVLSVMCPVRVTMEMDASCEMILQARSFQAL